MVQFMDLKFDTEEVATNVAGADVASLSCTLGRKQRAGFGGIEKIEEKTKFKKSADGEWLYLDAESKVLGEELNGVSRASKKSKMVKGTDQFGKAIS
jgi:hypothetical protein